MSPPRPLDGIDLNLLVTLRALVEASSVTVAASKLGTTSSPAHHRWSTQS